MSDQIRLLLVKENFLQCSGIFHATNKRLDKSDIERIFNSYDRVGPALFRAEMAT